jgi:hypothetical protein
LLEILRRLFGWLVAERRSDDFAQRRPIRPCGVEIVEKVGVDVVEDRLAGPA